MAASAERKVLTVADIELDDVVSVLDKYGIKLVVKPDTAPITGSFWGDPEAGIVGKTVYVRGDTPIHSLLHESCHIICMNADRRDALDRDAGGNDLEEAAVCYLQIVLANCIASVGGARLMQDMDTWGYSFRLGSTRDWFTHDAEEAAEFLVNHGLLSGTRRPTFMLRS